MYAYIKCLSSGFHPLVKALMIYVLSCHSVTMHVELPLYLSQAKQYEMCEQAKTDPTQNRQIVIKGTMVAAIEYYKRPLALLVSNSPEFLSFYYSFNRWANSEPDQATQ